MNLRVIIILCLIMYGCKNEGKSAKSSAIEQDEVKKNDFNLEVYDFNEIKKFLDIKDDKVYVVNFWATWCAPCIKELPYFEQLLDQYKNKNVEVLLVSLDFPKHYEKKLIPFIEKHNLKSKVIVLNDPDSNSWISQVSESWSGAIPATLIYNKENRQFYEKSFDYEELKKEVEQFLK